MNFFHAFQKIKNLILIFIIFNSHIFDMVLLYNILFDEENNLKKKQNKKFREKLIA